MAIVHVTDLVKEYIRGANHIRALDGVDLTVDPGELVAIMGPSGSGKSTLLHILGCLDRATSGQVIIDGVEIDKTHPRALPRLRNEKIGFVFQSYHLIPTLTAWENVALPLRYRGLPRRQAREKTEYWLEKMGLADRLSHRPSELSGGQMQRVAIARGLVTDPALLLADEPTGELDTENSQQIMEILQEINAEGQTVMIVTHDPEVAGVCRRRITLRDGRLVH